jgi:tetratricopeptide (TPR) repeat protein
MCSYHTVQSKSSVFLSLRRWGVRLLMSTASLSPADFAPSVGYLGPPESTPYYPTGDLRGDRDIAFTTALDCLDDLEADPQENDDQIATSLFQLAQALSDLGLREYALNTSGYALDVLERLYVAEPNKSRLRVASVQSLRANILCDLKRNDEARDAADRAVTLCKELQDSQATPVPELAHALLNYAILLCSMGLNDESSAVAFELLCEDESQSDMREIFTLCRLCLSNTRIGADDSLGTEMAEQTIESTRTSSDANSQTVLAGALLANSKILSSAGQNDAASAISAEAVTLLRSMSAARPVFSLFLAHALDTHAGHLSEAMRKGESYSIRQDAVELWQRLKTTAGGAVARPLAWSLFELSKFRSKDDDKKSRREELRVAESAVDVFRQIVPLDAPGLGDALYNVAARMLELDNNREAATFAEESVQYFREALAEDTKYANDLIASLSLASSCLACTERGADALEYAKQAVEAQHERKGERGEQYNALLRKLLLDVVTRATEIDKGAEAFPWFQELQALGGLGGMHRFPHFDQQIK